MNDSQLPQFLPKRFKHLVPKLDKLTKKSYVRGHVQAFSLASFQQLLLENGPLEIQKARGFRIISGGILKHLEHYRWWWQINRWLGAMLPSLCIETQVLATKTRASSSAATHQLRRAA